MFHDIYQSRRVLVTGHTGFKGSWLCAWLHNLGATITGIALEMPEPNHFSLLDIPVESHLANIQNGSEIAAIVNQFQPEIVFHLAAQPIVRLSYQVPVETFASNVMGTVNILEACRKCPSVRAIVVISSDKCYENREQAAGYTEEAPMGGYDPYSASKGCTELVVSSYRRSFFNNGEYGKSHHTLLASARSGNVIGGGDWAPDRLIPDLVRAAAKGETTILRNPQSTRPWQHVLEPLSGYLQVGQRLLEGDISCASPWNFGPDDHTILTVQDAAQMLQNCWSDIRILCQPSSHAPHEATLLRLNCSKAARELHWHATLTPQETFEFTASWYRQYYTRNAVESMSQLKQYINLAIQQKLEWSN